MKKYALEMDRTVETIPPDVMSALMAWHWPGNVRELENFVERAVILSPGTSLRAPLDDLRPDETRVAGSSTLEQVERDHIIRVLQETGGVVTMAAARLGMPRTTLNAVMRKLGISAKEPAVSR